MERRGIQILFVMVFLVALLMSVDLLEVDTRTTVRTILIAPRREFVLTEGQRIASGM